MNDAQIREEFGNTVGIVGDLDATCDWWLALLARKHKAWVEEVEELVKSVTPRLFDEMVGMVDEVVGWDDYCTGVSDAKHKMLEKLSTLKESLKDKE
jgi:hypothetical protein